MPRFSLLKSRLTLLLMVIAAFTAISWASDASLADVQGASMGNSAAAGGDQAPTKTFWIYAYAFPAFGVLALMFTFWKASWVARQEAGTDRMIRIAKNISDGAMSFLKAEYSILAFFVIIVAGLLYLGGEVGEGSHPLIALSFVLGALCSGLAGFIGMRVATKANVRTTNAARSGLGKALEVAFTGGSVMGMGVVGLGRLGSKHFVHHLLRRCLVLTNPQSNLTRVITVLTGFSFGASSIALFARVGGGIYTKAADVGADLVGKVEAGNSGRPSAQSGDDRRQRRRQRR